MKSLHKTAIQLHLFPEKKNMEGGTMGDGETKAISEEAVAYHSKDFEWDELRRVVESDPSLRYHLSPFQSSATSTNRLGSTAWSNFYTRHSTGKFFKERRYLLKEFPELVTCADYSKLLEVGCGNGSTLIPILRAKEKIAVFACDCSTEALERAKENLEHANIVCAEDRFHTFCCDFSTAGFPRWLACNLCRESEKPFCCYLDNAISEGNFASKLSLSDKESSCIGGMDFITLIFTLSAVPSERMPLAIKECFSVLKHGGMLFFRDYGLYDMTMLRFQPEKRVGLREYVRNDGTLSYFFSLDVIRDLFLGAGFIELELDYCCIKSVNRRKEKCMNRVWVHGKFQKPL